MKLGTHIGSDNIAMGKTLDLIIIELWPFFDLEITDECWRSLCGALIYICYKQDMHMCTALNLSFHIIYSFMKTL